MTGRRDLAGLFAITLIAVLVAAAYSAGVLGGDALHLMPLLALALPLLGGRYVGEERIAALAAARRGPRVVRVRATRTALPRPRVTAPRGGALIARALARRGPPAPAV